jgi:hypothetical protein
VAVGCRALPLSCFATCNADGSEPGVGDTLAAAGALGGGSVVAPGTARGHGTAEAALLTAPLVAASESA